MSDAWLELEGLQMRFQGLMALGDVSFGVPKGSITSVIGPNGAGKTTLFNCIAGMYRPTAGSVRFDGQDITGFRPPQIARRGIARTFQNLALFTGLTVLENLLVGSYLQGRSGLLQGMFRSGRSRREQAESQAAAHAILGFLGMEALADALPGELPYGQQKQVEFARALMQEARLVLLDEPMAGMSSAEKSDMTQLILRARQQFGVSFLIVEHDIPVIMRLSDKIVVLDFGKKIAEGRPADIQNNQAVIDAYLGAPATDADSTLQPDAGADDGR